MTLNFYLISTIISLIADMIMERVCGCKVEAERKGYKFTKKKEHKLLLFLLDKLYCFIPIVNIITSICVVIGYITEKYMYFSFGRSKVYEEYFWAKIWAWEKQCKIYNVKERELLTSLYKSAAGSVAKKQEDEDNQITLKEEKTYDEMSNKEKLVFLQKEREKIIKSCNSTSSSPSNKEEPPTSSNSVNKTYTLKK